MKLLVLIVILGIANCVEYRVIGLNISNQLIDLKPVSSEAKLKIENNKIVLRSYCNTCEIFNDKNYSCTEMACSSKIMMLESFLINFFSKLNFVESNLLESSPLKEIKNGLDKVTLLRID